MVVVDTHQSPSAARVLIGKIAKLTPLPVRYIVNTHWHGDHVYGNQSYEERFEEVEFVGHVNTRADMESKGPRGVDTDRQGTERAGSDRRRDRSVAWERPTPGGVSGGAEGLRLMPPDVTFEEGLTLADHASPPIQLLHFGPAHTRGDVVVYLPAQRILAVGDLLENGLPWVDERRGEPFREYARTVATQAYQVVAAGR